VCAFAAGLLAGCLDPAVSSLVDCCVDCCVQCRVVPPWDKEEEEEEAVSQATVSLGQVRWMIDAGRGGCERKEATKAGRSRWNRLAERRRLLFDKFENKCKKRERGREGGWEGLHAACHVFLVSSRYV